MDRRSPFEFDISVSADKKRRSRNRGKSGEVRNSIRTCEKPGCNQPGKYRAPKSPDNLDEFYWFCLDHVREYNLKWNFFENHSAEELEEQMAQDRVWDRKTKPMGRGKEGHPEGRAWHRLGLDDPTELLGENATLNPPAGSEASGTARNARRLPPTERRALTILEALDCETKSEVRRQYKALVKVLHPDMNGGNRDDEERLSEVVWAWEQIKASHVIPE